jgi:hypothetical protein
VIIALSIVAGLVWVSVLNRSDSTAARSCQAATQAAAGSSLAAAAASPGERLPSAGLDAVPPASPQHVVVQVLNANGQRGEAAMVAAGLASLGFEPTSEPTNDPLHPSFDLRCHGEIRFGAAGEAAARTLSLAMPCAELVRDVRPDARIDLALGTRFTSLRPNEAAREALQGLVQLGQPVLVSRGGQAAAVVAPPVDPALLHAARQVDC